jgi:hypothetical protein
VAVNIAAVMKVLDVWDLDYSAKHALLVIACRADRHTGAVTVAIPRVAADMHVDYRTALRALYRALAAGYLTVDKSPGFTSTWRLVLAQVTGVPPTPVTGVPLSTTPPGTDTGDRGVLTPGSSTKESLDINKGERPDTVVAASAREGRAAPPVENLPAGVEADREVNARMVAMTHEILALEGPEREAKSAELDTLIRAAAFRHPSRLNGDTPP